MNKVKKENLIERPPVVVIMGHIDHGKSTLLDFIRKTNTVAKEAGNITQHISAYEVVQQHPSGEKKITFIDTPGHAAFCNVRSTGACIADIAVLIISAEDSVKPQTIEAYKNIQQTKTPFVVAINKIDKPNADIAKVKQDLLENEIFLEGLGGDIPFVEISAKTGQGVPDLLETILLLAEMEELKGDPNQPAGGFVLEASVNKQRGIEIMVVIKNGTLQTGNFLLVKDKVSSVRRIESFSGKLLKTATFSSPVRLTGFNYIPETGEVFESYFTKKEAEQAGQIYQKTLEKSQSNSVQDEIVSSSDGEATDILIIIKADVFGTIDAIQQEIKKIKLERANIKIIKTGVGDINENDIKSAGHKKNSLIVGFNVKANARIRDLAERQGVEIYTVNVIYKLTEWIEEKIKQFIPKTSVEEKIGLAKVVKVFSKNKDNQIIGGKVKEGKLNLSSEVKILRSDYEIGRGIITNIQSQKIQTKEVKEKDEFGMRIKSKVEIAPGDKLEAFVVVEK